MVINPATTAIAEPEPLEITIGPNPATGHIVITNKSASKVAFIVYNAMGCKVAETITETGARTMDLTAFPNGLYFYSLLDENNKLILSSKLVIQN